VEFLIGFLIIVFIFFVYNGKRSSNWNSQYRIALGSYFGLKPEQAKNENNFDGVCKFEENPIVTNIRLSKGENVYAAFHNLSLMEYKRDGGVGAYGITLRKKVLPGVFLRGGVGKFGISKSWQSETTGSLYITNKGVVYDGGMKNIKLPWNKIMKENILENEIQIEKSNGQPIILQGNIDPQEAAKFTVVSRMYESL
jgi:hypothetical protein